MKKQQIAIVGAGPAGLAAALYLHRAGHDVKLLERFAAPSPLGSGLILQPTGLTVLDDLGLFDRIASLGNRIDRLYGADALSGRAVLDVRYAALKSGRYGIAVHRAALFDVLYQAVLQERIDITTNVDVITMHTGQWPGMADDQYGPQHRHVRSGHRCQRIALAAQAVCHSSQ